MRRAKLTNKRHGRLETVENPDGTFHVRLKAANGRILMHSEQLTGKQWGRAIVTICVALQDHEDAVRDDCQCRGCLRQKGLQ